MRKLTYLITEDEPQSQRIYSIEFITDKTSKWTEQQYLRHRGNTKMELISDEEAEETEPLSREVDLG